MSSSSGIFRANPGLLVGVVLCLGIPLVLALVAAIMRASGASLRPIVFVGGLMLPTAVIFLIGSLVRAREPGAEPESTLSLPMSEGHLVDRNYLFGAEVSERDIRDAKSVFPEFFVEAEVAELALVGTGESVLAAQFPNAESAKRAAAVLWQTFRMTNTSGDETRGWRGKRQQNGDYVELLRTGRHLFFWTGATKEAAAARRKASNLATTAAQVETRALFPRLNQLGDLFQSTGVKVLGFAALFVIYTFWFFKGSAWAGSSPAEPGAVAVSSGELATRLEAVNALDVPFRVERGEQPNEFFATWRYADAKWVDLARAHGMRRTFRMRLILDESAHTVRATDYTADFDWSAGADRARLGWQSSLGIVFFQIDHHRVFGLQLDEQGKFKPELSYTYKFNLLEMKTPLIAATTRAGWTWRPTAWQGPTWLRWLTE